MPDPIEPLKHNDTSYFPFHNGIERIDAEQSDDVDTMRLNNPELHRTDNNTSLQFQNAIRSVQPITGKKYSVLYHNDIRYVMLPSRPFVDMGYVVRDGDCFYRFSVLKHQSFYYLDVDLANAYEFVVESTNETIPLFVIDTLQGQIRSQKIGWVMLRGIPDTIVVSQT